MELGSEFLDRIGLINEIRERFVLDLHGIHGIRHWARVRRHGLRLAEQTGANALIVELFAFLHDSCRLNEYSDAVHGDRAADYAMSLNTRYFELGRTDLERLCYAIRHHSDGMISEDRTIQCCWDADRLDLGRVGYVPDPFYLSEVAHGYISEAYAWSRQTPLSVIRGGGT